MIPYIHVPDLDLFGLPLHPFGLLVATGVIIGTALATRRARRRGFDLDKLNSFITWMLVAGFIGGHVLDELFYHPRQAIEDPISLLKLWTGLSSFGGFTGAFIGIVLWKFFDSEQKVVLGMKLPRFFRREKTMPILPFADLILSVFPVAWIFGRSGCSVVHDHPGAPVTAGMPGSFLAVAYPAANPGIATGPGERTHLGPIELVMGHYPRFDLGTLELMFTIVLAGLLALTWRKRLPCGTYVVATSLAYAPVRFAMDFLRIRLGDSADPRYGGLTPAQWECILLFAFGLGMLAYVIRLVKQGRDPRDAVMAPEEPVGRQEGPAPA
jgi:phosphatidylglycerol:prolipoprotein diacylglycerol transferase